MMSIVLCNGMIWREIEQKLTSASPLFELVNWPLFNSWVARPTGDLQLRRFGFGQAEVDKSSAHDSPHPVMMVHYIWQFCTIQERGRLRQVHSSWRKYASLRMEASTTQSWDLQKPRPAHLKEAATVTLNPARAHAHSILLLKFDFLHGDVTRWMGGEYTNATRRFDREWVQILDKLDSVPPPECPPLHPTAAFRVQTGGAPLKANYTTPHSILDKRNTYDNHPAVKENHEKVEAKFAKEEWKSYHIHYHRWLFPFVYGLVINPIQWVFDKGKGRICIDCTNGPDSRGSVNTYIPKPLNTKKKPEGMKLDFDECPPTYFKYAFKRVIRRILRMRISRPTEPILVHADDIGAAFRRILYHPDVAIAFAYVFSDYLIIPVGQVFGGRSSPPFYGLLADLREVLAMVQPPVPSSLFHDLVQKTTFPPVPLGAPLITIPADSHHPALSEAELVTPFHASYVDDNATIAFQSEMAAAVDNSVKAAFAVFGESGCDRRGDCLQMDKWVPTVTECFTFLGFDIDTRLMTLKWPRAKRAALHKEISGILARQGKDRWVSPQEMAHLVGVVRSASEVAPWGTFLSFNLQNALTKAAQNAKKPDRTLYSKHKIYLSNTAVQTLTQLTETLLDPDETLWTRPMALYFDRDCTHRVYSDASYIGIGGWSPCFSFCWRILRDDLSQYGFHMKTVDRSTSEPTGTAAGLHINPLEYLAAIVNLWLALTFLMDAGPIDGGYILQLNADNTSALAWFSEAARTPDPFLQGLARLGSAFLVCACRLLTKVVPTHIAGKKNVEADALSRPLAGNVVPPLDYVMQQWPHLQTCRVCLLPSRLLREIAAITSSQKTGVSFDMLATELLTLRPNILSRGVNTCILKSTLFDD